MSKVNVSIQSFNQEDEGFWQLMGRYFASAQVKRELGVAMSSDESYQWFLAFVDGEMAGFCAMSAAKAHTDLRHVYVLTQYRNNSVAKHLVAAAVTAVKKPIKATVKADMLPFYEKFGFKKVGDRGQYVQIVKE